MKNLLLAIVLFTASVQTSVYTVTNHVYFDIMIDDHPAGRMIIGLFGTIAPRTVDNFITIAESGIDGKTYTGSLFHRVIKRFLIQSGDILNNNGTGSISIYGTYFNDETFEVNHTLPGFVGMANAGKNTNGCQFYINTIPTPWLDGQHVVFGKVVEGMDVIFKIEQTKTDSDDIPTVPIVISESGSLKLEQSYTISDDPYSIWEWIKATAVPLSFSFTILGFFQWIMRQLDV